MSKQRLLTIRNELGEEDDEKRCDQVVDSLHVAAGRSSNRPNIQDPFEDLLDQLLLKERYQRTHPRNVNVNLEND